MAEESVAIVGGRVVPVTGDPIDGGTVLAEAGGSPRSALTSLFPPGSGSSMRRAAGSCPGSSRRTATWACMRKAKAGPARTPTS